MHLAKQFIELHPNNKTHTLHHSSQFIIEQTYLMITVSWIWTHKRMATDNFLGCKYIT